MNRLAIVGGTLLLAANAIGAEEAFDPRSVPPGSIVRIAARRPPINLGRAEVVECTSNAVTLRHDRDRFTVALSNVLELAVLEKGKEIVEPGAGQNGASPKKGGPAAKSTNLWDRIKGFWK
jgi:hypothetical protein